MVKLINFVVNRKYTNVLKYLQHKVGTGTCLPQCFLLTTVSKHLRTEDTNYLKWKSSPFLFHDHPNLLNSLVFLLSYFAHHNA